MDKEDIFLSVIIPAYNEEKRIVKTLRAISSYLENQSYSYEIIIVSDGAEDDTAEAVQKAGPTIPKIRLIDRKENKGKGYTVREGMLSAQGKIRLFTDADNSTDISNFEKMRPLFDKGYDVVISTRHPKDAKGARQEVSQSWYKRLMGIIGNLYIQMMAVPGIWDTQNGFKAFRNCAAQKIFSRTKINRWAFDVEALNLARKFKYKIGIIPIHWKNDPSSQVSLAAYFKFLIDILRMRWNLMRKKYD